MLHYWILILIFTTCGHGNCAIAAAAPQGGFASLDACATAGKSVDRNYSGGDAIIITYSCEEHGDGR